MKRMANIEKRASRLLLLLMTAAVVLWLSPLPVQAQGEPAIAITAPADITGWALSPQGAQPKTQSGILTVTTTNANGHNWAVTAMDSENTTGHMTKYSGGTYIPGIKLSAAMQVQGNNGTATLPTAGNVVTGTGTVTNAQYTITFKQSVSWTDAVVAAPDSYRIVVTFTGSIAP